MSEIALNIYKKGKDGWEVDKTYKTDSYDLMLGTVEDFLEVVNLEKMDDGVELTKMVKAMFGQLSPLLKDIFPGLNDEELKRTKAKEVVRTLVQTITAVVDSLSNLKAGN